jgi:hypothetical protein
VSCRRQALKTGSAAAAGSSQPAASQQPDSQNTAHFSWAMCVVLISFIYNLGLTINTYKGPPRGVYACPHNEMPLIGLGTAVYNPTVLYF